LPVGPLTGTFGGMALDGVGAHLPVVPWTDTVAAAVIADLAVAATPTASPATPAPAATIMAATVVSRTVHSRMMPLRA
jgi:hypothetical protein